MMFGVQSITENKNLSAEALRLDVRRSWLTAKGLVSVGTPGAFHQLPPTLLLFLLRTLFFSNCPGSPHCRCRRRFLIGHTLLSIFCMWTRANISTKKCTFVLKSMDSFTFVLPIRVAGVALRYIYTCVYPLR